MRWAGTLAPGAVVNVAACGGDDGAASKTTACESAFANAAAVRDVEDTVEDLDPAVRACATVEE